MTQHKDLFAALAAPFEPGEVKMRKQAGHELHYVTARTVMNRLDEVIGPESWWDDYVPTEHSVVCRLTIRLPDGQVLTKTDAGGFAGMADPGDDDKSGYSDAFKRAAVKFGVGRYLYRDGIPRFAREAIVQQPDGQAPRPEPSHQRGGNGKARNGYSDPRTGAALYAKIKQHDDEHPGRNLLKAINAWGKREGLHFRMTEWDETAVARALEECRRLIREFDAQHKTAAPVTQAEADMTDDEWEDGRE